MSDTAVALAVVAVVVVVLLVAAAIAAHRRREAMAAYAAARGWRFEAQQPLLVDRFTGPPFGTGTDRRATNVVYGSHDGRDFVSFDYTYRTRSGSGKSSSTRSHRFSVLALRMGLDMPTLRVDPEGWLDRLVGGLTGEDFDLESEEFNQAFAVSCPDRRFASDVLHPRMMELLLRYRNFGWRFERDSMLVVAAGHRTPDQIDATLAVMDALTDLVPEFVWLRLRGLG